MTAQALQIAIRLASTVILARLLVPEDYGILAMVMAITNFANLFRDLGLSTAAIQKKDLSAAQQSNLFWLNVGVGIVLTCAVAFSSPLVVSFFGEPRLFGITIVLSSCFLINGLGAQHGAALLREMRFTAKAGSTVAGSATFLLVSVVLAMNGASYWSLVWGNLAGDAVTTLILIACSAFRPGPITRKCGTRKLVEFGGNITAFNFVNYFSRNLDNILIGRVWGSAQLGFYSRSYHLMMLPINAIRAPVQSVAFPSMSKLDPESPEFRKYYNKMCAIIALATMPLMGVLFTCSDAIIEIALGVGWSKSSEIFSVLAIVGFIQPVAGTRGLVMLASGNGRLYFINGVLAAIAITTGFLIGVQWGAVGVAWAYGIVIWITFYPLYLLSIRGTSIAPLDLIHACWIPAVYTLLGVLLCVLFEQTASTGSVLLAASVKSGLIVATAGCGVFFHAHSRNILICDIGSVLVSNKIFSLFRGLGTRFKSSSKR